MYVIVISGDKISFLMVYIGQKRRKNLTNNDSSSLSVRNDLTLIFIEV